MHLQPPVKTMIILMASSATNQNLPPPQPQKSHPSQTLDPVPYIDMTILTKI